ncbi:MAG: hypothetical protein ACI9CD_000334 [Candidatus Deianiraeaceae bacterium]|jgi:hypothetical protein
MMRIFCKQNMINDVTLLIQGKMHHNILKMVEEYKDIFPNIIISTWKQERDEFAFPKNVIFIEKELPEIHSQFNQVNSYYQISSTLNGLLHIKTKHTLKVRSDEFYSNLDKVVKQYDGRKMLCSNIFFCQITKKNLFHISDHCFLAATDILKTTFQALESYHRNNLDFHNILNNTFSIERRIAVFYLAKKYGYDVNELLKMNTRECYKTMRKKFNIFDIESLRPYEVKWNHNPSGNKTLEDLHNSDTYIQAMGKNISTIRDIKPKRRFF